VWSGEEGVLWWASKIVRLPHALVSSHRACALCLRVSLRALQAYALCFVVIGGWIVFRFIGPATGLYALKSGLTDIPGGR
jgi:hypothetical protein